MGLTFLTGGVRCGKSRLAVELLSGSGRPVVFIATGEERDAEMAARIADHRDERPATWSTVEEPLLLGAAIEGVPSNTPLLVDCLTLWVANLLEHGQSDGEIRSLAEEASAILAKRPGRSVVVSNEVGLGIIAADGPTRRYCDLLGGVNATFARAADRAALVVAGRMLPLLADHERSWALGEP